MHKGSDGRPRSVPAFARDATDIDPVSPRLAVMLGHPQDLIEAHAWGMVDLRENLDVVAIEVSWFAFAQAKELRQVQNILRPPLEWNTVLGGQRRRLPLAIPRQQHPLEPPIRLPFQLPLHPCRVHQRRNRDRQDMHLKIHERTPPHLSCGRSHHSLSQSARQ